MKKLLHSAVAVVVTTSVTMISSVASANSSVTLYGVVDTGVEYITNVNAAGDSVMRMPSLTGSVPSRIGFKGSDDVGGGWNAVFVLESGFAPDRGVTGQGNRVFGRQSYVGLKNNHSSFTLGRVNNMSYFAPMSADVMGLHIFSIFSFDPYLANARSDNAVAYLGKFSNVSVGATYSLGRDTSAAGEPAATGCPGETAGDAKACRQITALLGYDNSAFGVTAAYDIMYGGAGSAAVALDAGGSVGVGLTQAGVMTGIRHRF